MSALGDKLKAASNKRGAGHGTSIVDNLIASYGAADAKDLSEALSEFDVNRGVWRVSARQVSDILAEFGQDISVSTISTYRAKNRFKEKATAAAHAAVPVA